LIKDLQLAKKFEDDFCKRRNIDILRRGTDGLKNKKYVIDIKHEKDAMEFEQSPFK
jgi:hypothetical protein